MSSITQSIININSLDEAAELDSFLHRLNPLVKILTTLFFLVAVTSIPIYDIWMVLPFFSYLIFALIISGLPTAFLFRRLIPVLPMVAFAGCANLIFDHNFVQIGGIAVRGGLISFAVLLLKASLTVGAVLILGATTPLNKLSGALRSLKVPCVIILQLLLLWRYLPIILEEAQNMYHAYQLRSGRRNGVALMDWPKFIGSLLLSSIERAKRIYQAMQCRLFDARLSLEHSCKIRVAELIYLLIFILCCVFFRSAGVEL